jgi:hypothetical protein
LILNVLSALKGWVGLAPQGPGALHNQRFSALCIIIILRRPATRRIFSRAGHIRRCGGAICFHGFGGFFVKSKRVVPLPHHTTINKYFQV